MEFYHFSLFISIFNVLIYGCDLMEDYNNQVDLNVLALNTNENPTGLFGICFVDALHQCVHEICTKQDCSFIHNFCTVVFFIGSRSEGVDEVDHCENHH